MPAIQDHYPTEFAHCFGCGPANPRGHHLKSHLEGEDTVARFTPGAQYSGGYPGHVFGGMIASLLDCHGTASAAAFAYRQRGREMGDGGPAIRFVTASLTVAYRRPTPLGTELVIRGRLVSIEGRKVRIALTLSADADVCAEGEMLAVEYRAKAMAPGSGATP